VLVVAEVLGVPEAAVVVLVVKKPKKPVLRQRSKFYWALLVVQQCKLPKNKLKIVQPNDSCAITNKIM
jgi:hypothetical protein